MISKVSTFLGPNGLYQGISGTPSLVLSLDSNNVLSYPGTGTTWSDLSIRKNNGILNDVSSVTGSIPNTSLSFNGTGSYPSVKQITELLGNIVTVSQSNGQLIVPLCTRLTAPKLSIT